MAAEKGTITDFHSHILPQIDDGSRDVVMSLAMLRRLGEQGVTTCVATPHYYAYRQTAAEFLSRREAAMDALRPHLDAAMPRILPGAEAALCTDLMALPQEQLAALCIGGTDTLLLEMPFAQWTDWEVNALSCLCLDRRLRVVLAHPERYLSLQRSEGYLRRILRLPLWIQVNGEDLTSLRRRRSVLKLCAAGTPTLLGSDCHNMTDRPPELLRPRRVVEKHLGAAVLAQMDAAAEMLLAPREVAAP